MQFQCCHYRKDMKQRPSSNQTGHHFTSLSLELAYIHYCRLHHQSRQHSCTVSATPHRTVAKDMVIVNHVAEEQLRTLPFSKEQRKRNGKLEHL